MTTSESQPAEGKVHPNGPRCQCGHAKVAHWIPPSVVDGACDVRCDCENYVPVPEVRDEGAAMSFEQELTALINRHSQENLSNTPDFILAQYVLDALLAFNRATSARDQWHGIKTFVDRLNEPLEAPRPDEGALDRLAEDLRWFMRHDEACGTLKRAALRTVCDCGYERALQAVRAIER